MEAYKNLLQLRNRQQKKNFVDVLAPAVSDQNILRDRDVVPEIRANEIVFGTDLGSGAYGVVLRGTCRSMPVAVKILKKKGWNSQDVEILKKEVSILTKIFHPNICLFMGACYEPGKMMIVSELMENGDLKELIYSSAELPVLMRVRMLRDAARGMCWLHERESPILHRDLKPANLLIDKHWRVKICDFGLSEIMKKGEPESDAPKKNERESSLDGS